MLCIINAGRVHCGTARAYVSMSVIKLTQRDAWKIFPVQPFCAAYFFMSLSNFPSVPPLNSFSASPFHSPESIGSL